MAVGEGRVIVGLAPNQQPTGRPLRAVTIVTELFILQALANNAVANEVSQSLETKHELAIHRLRRRCQECK
jgi:hypothetical protein